MSNRLLDTHHKYRQFVTYDQFFLVYDIQELQFQLKTEVKKNGRRSYPSDFFKHIHPPKCTWMLNHCHASAMEWKDRRMQNTCNIQQSYTIVTPGSEILIDTLNLLICGYYTEFNMKFKMGDEFSS